MGTSVGVKKFEKAFDIAWVSMSPAVQSLPDFEKMEQCARTGCVYIGWGRKRNNDLMEDIFGLHCLPFGPPPGVEAAYDILVRAGRTPCSPKFFDASWEWAGTVEDALEEMVGFIESTEKRYSPFDWLGADNVAERVPTGIGSHVFMDKEGLLKLNPDVIFIDGGGLALVREDIRKKPEFFKALKAFADDRVYALLPFNWYTTNIDTALADAYAIGKILYPEQFADIDSERKADEIYTFLVGKPVYPAMKKDYGVIGRKVRFLRARAKGWIP